MSNKKGPLVELGFDKIKKKIGYWDAMDAGETIDAVTNGTGPLANEEDIIDAEKSLYSDKNQAGINKPRSSITSKILGFIPVEDDLKEEKKNRGYDPNKPMEDQVRREDYGEWAERRKAELRDEMSGGDSIIEKKLDERLEGKIESIENKDDRAVDEYFSGINSAKLKRKDEYKP